MARPSNDGKSDGQVDWDEYQPTNNGQQGNYQGGTGGVPAQPNSGQLASSGSPAADADERFIRDWVADQGANKLKFDLNVTTPNRYVPQPEQIDYYEASNNGLLQAPESIRRALNAATGGDVTQWDAIYEAALNMAATEQYAGESTSLEAAIFRVAKMAREEQAGGGSGGGGGPRAFTNTTISRNLTNESTAQGILNSALSNALGRRATAAENAAFLKALNLQERENPSKTVTKGVTSQSGTNSDSTTTGGFDNVAFADKFARSQEGYAEYQAATTQMDNFIKALTGNRRRVI